MNPTTEGKIAEPFCPITGSWLLSRDRNTYSHIGAKIIAHWRKGMRVRALMPFIFLFFSGACLATALFVPELREPASLSFCILTTLMTIGWSIPQSLVVGAKGQRFFLHGFFSFDLWVGFVLLLLLAEAMLQIPLLIRDQLWELRWPAEVADYLPLFIVNCLWVFSRTFEAKCTASAFQIHPENLSWQGDGLPRKEILRMQLGLVGLSLLFIGGISFILFGVLGRPFEHPSLVVAAVLPATMPLFGQLTSGFMRDAERLGFYLRNFQAFKDLKRIGLIICHYTGALTQLSPRLEGIWFDTTDLWNEEEIRDVLYQLSEGLEHPLSLLAQEECPRPNRLLTKMIDRKRVDHLGISATLRDVQGREAHAVLGGMTWHKALQHEIDALGMERVRVWREAKADIVLLAMNRKVVAAIAYSHQIREDVQNEVDALNRKGIPSVAISSSYPPEQRVEQVFKETALNMLPIERRIQLQYWHERNPKMFELKAWWDSSDTQLPSARFTSIDRVDKTPGDLLYVGTTNAWEAFHWSIRAAKRWKFWIPVIWVLIPALCVLSLLVSNPWAAFALPFLAAYLLGRGRLQTAH